VILVVLCLWVAPVLGQPKEPYYHYLGRKNNLLGGWNWHFLKDSRGLVWISSPFGLNCFDGHAVRQYLPEEGRSGLPKSLTINGKFVEDRFANVWFGAGDRLCRYDRAQAHFNNYALCDPVGRDASDANCHVVEIDKNGSIWAMSENTDLSTTIWCSEGPHFRAIRDFPEVFNRCVAHKNAAGQLEAMALFGWKSDRICLFDPKTKRCTTPDLSASGKRPLIYQALFREETMWLATDTCLIAYHLPSGKRPLIYQALFREETMWLATDTCLIAYHLPSGKARCYFVPQTARPLSALTLDGDKGLWAGSWTGQLLYLDWQRGIGQLALLDRHPSAPGGGKTHITNLYVDDNRTLWIAFQSGGVAWTAPHRARFSTLKASALGAGQLKHLLSLAQDAQGQTWGADSTALLNLSDGNAQRVVIIPDSGIYLKKMAFDAKGRICLMSNAALMLFDPRTGRLRTLHKAAAAQKDFLDFCPLDDQRVLLLTHGAAIVLAEDALGNFFTDTLRKPPLRGCSASYQDREGTIYISESIQRLHMLRLVGDSLWTVRNALPIRGDIYDWVEDDEYVWAGTDYGLARIHKRRLEAKVFGAQDGMPTQSILALEETQSGAEIWLAGYDRLVRFDKKSGRIVFFGQSDGLPPLSFLRGAAVGPSTHGGMWFSCGEHLVAFSPGQVRTDSSPAKVLISGILVNGLRDPALRCATSGSANPNEMQYLRLSDNTHTLSIELLAIEYGNPAQNRLQYRFEENTPWLDLPSPGSVTLNNPAAGKFRLFIRAINADGVANGPEKALLFYIKPPFQQTIWFYLLCAAVAALAVWWYQQSKIAGLRRYEAMRQQIADDLHDGVGSPLNSILASSTILSLSLRDQLAEGHMSHLNQIKANVEKAFSAYRSAIWGINPRYDKMQDLLLRMKESSSRVAETTGIHCRLLPNMADEQMKLNPQLRHNVFLFFEEALHNAVRHSGAKAIDIRLELLGDQLLLEVADDGKGFNPLAAQGGNGLPSLTKRATKLGGQCSIVPNTPQGSRVALRCPLNRR
jgi:signal transduction histidine kinase/ligand-binding sensor domain-containing protein